MFGGKIGEEVVRYRPQRTRFYLWGFLRLCQFLWKSIKKCDRESARRRTDRQWQTQIGFIICSMLCTVAMGQIKRVGNLVASKRCWRRSAYLEQLSGWKAVADRVRQELSRTIKKSNSWCWVEKISRRHTSQFVRSQEELASRGRQRAELFILIFNSSAWIVNKCSCCQKQVAENVSSSDTLQTTAETVSEPCHRLRAV